MRTFVVFVVIIIVIIRIVIVIIIIIIIIIIYSFFLALDVSWSIAGSPPVGQDAVAVVTHPDGLCSCCWVHVSDHESGRAWTSSASVH